jgi:hypothetical protein
MSPYDFRGLIVKGAEGTLQEVDLSEWNLHYDASACKTAFGYYKRVIIAKKRGSRILQVPNFELKKYQKVLLTQLNEKFQFPDCVSAVKGKSYVDNATAHKDARHVLRVDIKAFYDSVNAAKVRDVVAANFSPEQDFWFALRVPFMFTQHMDDDSTTYRRAFLPTGAPTSPFVANLACTELDRNIQERIVSKYPGCKYTRYIDDLTLSFSEQLSPEQMNEIKRLVIQYIENEGWKAHPAKSKWINPNNDQYTVTGVDIRGEPKVTGQYIKKKVRPLLDLNARLFHTEPTVLPQFVWGKEPSRYDTFEKCLPIVFPHASPFLAYVKQVSPSQYSLCIEYFKKRLNLYALSNRHIADSWIHVQYPTWTSTYNLPATEDLDKLNGVEELIPFIVQFLIQDKQDRLAKGIDDLPF